MLEFSDKISGALTSMFPPLPPCAPPEVVIALPLASLNVFPDLSVTVPPELPGVPSSPRALICESAPKVSESEAPSSMTPFSSFTELAWSKPF